ncbi:MAG: hypothetical protein IPK77_14460 [Cellvibrio sp.]|nr:hypothetical protein [Cellvibrio sp.]
MNNGINIESCLHKLINLMLAIVLSTSMNVIASSCPDIATLGAVSNNSAFAKFNTVTINSALSTYSCVTIPKGIFWVSVSAGGIIVSSGNTIKGVNSESSMLVAADRSPGSIISRKIPIARDDYVQGVRIHDIGVVLNHGTYHTQNPVMIGIDFSHITGSHISNVYVGNAPEGIAKLAIPTPPKSDQTQGIGIKLCTYNSGLGTLYSGGERNIIEKTKIWGAKIGISIDDQTCNQSAAHATIIRDSDIQTVEYGIAQQSNATAGVTLSGNTIQDFVSAGGNPETMMCAYYIKGYSINIQGGYIEGRSTNPLFALYLGDNAHGVKADLGYVSLNVPDSNHPGTPTPLVQMIRMAGYRNLITGYDMFSSGNWINLSN